MSSDDGAVEPPSSGVERVEGKVELSDVIVIETTDDQKLSFEIVGIVEDDEDHTTYAVAYSEATDDFVVTDEFGTLLADDELAQEILDDFFVLAEEAQPSEN